MGDGQSVNVAALQLHRQGEEGLQELLQRPEPNDASFDLNAIRMYVSVKDIGAIVINFPIAAIAKRIQWNRRNKTGISPSREVEVGLAFVLFLV